MFIEALFGIILYIFNEILVACTSPGNVFFPVATSADNGEGAKWLQAYLEF